MAARSALGLSARTVIIVALFASVLASSASPASAELAPGCQEPPPVLHPWEISPLWANPDSYQRDRFPNGDLPRGATHEGVDLGEPVRYSSLDPDFTDGISFNDKAAGDEHIAGTLVIVEGPQHQDPGAFDPPFESRGRTIYQDGSFAVREDGSFRWVPEDGYAGGDSFTYYRQTGSAEAGDGPYCTHVVTVDIPPRQTANTKPDAIQVPADTIYRSPCSGGPAVGGEIGEEDCESILDNDWNANPPGDLRSSVAMVSGCSTCTATGRDGQWVGTAHGSVRVSADGQVEYVPAEGFAGTDRFYYAVSTREVDVWQGNGLGYGSLTFSNWPEGDIRNSPEVWQLVELEVVNAAPEPRPDALTLTEDHVQPFAASVLTANDSPFTLQVADLTDALGRSLEPAACQPGTVCADLERDLIAAVTRRPASQGGTIESFQLIPRVDFNGTTTIRYVPVTPSGTRLDPTTVTVTVEPVPDAPVAAPDAAELRLPDRSVTVPVLANDRDAESDIVPSATRRVGGPSCPFPGAQPPFDRCALDDAILNGTWVTEPDGSLRYTLGEGFAWSSGETTRTVTADYRIEDQTGRTATSTVTVKILRWPLADDAYTTDEDQRLTVAAPGVLGNDAVAADQAPAVELVAGPAHGVLDLRPDGSFDYLPTAGFNGTDTFTYAAGGDQATVALTVRAVNDPPVLSGVVACAGATPCQTADGPVDLAEGGSVALRGEVRDLDGDGDGGVVRVTWGDGQTQDLHYPCFPGTTGCAFTETDSGWAFTATHTYADDPPGGDDSVDLRVVADDGIAVSAPATSKVRVANVAPTVEIAECPPGACLVGSVLEQNLGHPIHLTGTVTDPGLDGGSITIDWGDGSEPQVLAFGCGGGQICPTPTRQPGQCGADPKPSCGVFEVQHSYAAMGPYEIVVTVRDDDGATGSDSTTAKVYRHPIINAPSTVALAEGLPTSIEVSATGYPVPRMWIDGALPEGLSFVDRGDGTGLLQGTPADGSRGTYKVTVMARNGPMVAKEMTITVAPRLRITTEGLPPGTVGMAYASAMTADGGTSPRVFSVAEGPLPAGLTLHADGTLSGTPSGPAGATTFTVRVQDAGNPVQTAERALTIVIEPGPTRLTVDPAILQRRVGAFRVTVGSVSAVLRSTSGTPIAGEAVAFSTGGVALCSATTGSNGRATCTTSASGLVAVLLRGTVTARFAGSDSWRPSSASAWLIGG